MIAIAAGIFAAVQVGKVPPLITLLQTELGLSLVAAGWLASLFNLTGALFGVMGGAMTDKVGARHVLMVGLGGMALAGFGGAMAPDPVWLLSFRVFESVSFLACVVTAPRLIVAATALHQRDLAMGAWGSYMPIGMVLAMLGAPSAAGQFGWQGVWIGAAGLALICLLVAAWVTAPHRWPQASSVGAALSWHVLAQVVWRLGPMLMGLCFALYTVQFFAISSWLPTYLIEVLAYTPGRAGMATALVVAGNALGNLLGALLLHRGARRAALVADITCLCHDAGMFRGYIFAHPVGHLEDARGLCLQFLRWIFACRHCGRDSRPCAPSRHGRDRHWRRHPGRQYRQLGRTARHGADDCRLWRLGRDLLADGRLQCRGRRAGDLVAEHREAPGHRVKPGHPKNY